MAEFVEVMRQAERMCRAQEDCDECPVCNALDCVCVIADLIELDLEKMENIVMRWAAENPEPRYPTWAEWQRANFPNAKRNICLMNFVGHNACFNQDWCDTCLNQPIPADIAEKLGIKPIGGGLPHDTSDMR